MTSWVVASVATIAVAFGGVVLTLSLASLAKEWWQKRRLR